MSSSSVDKETLEGPSVSLSPGLPVSLSLTEPLVQVHGLNYAFGEGETRKQILFDVDLDINAGETMILTGPSGSGKTTLLTLIGALRSIQTGSILVLGQQLGGLDVLGLSSIRRDIGFIFQAHNLFPALNAYQNVRMALELKNHPEQEIRTRALAMLSAVGLGERLHHKPRQLSGGQRQRVAIARALVNRPRLILADEPTAALDKESGKAVIGLFQQLMREEQSAVVLVTHDPRILESANRIVNMVDGRIVSDVNTQLTLLICEFLRGCSIFASHSPLALTEIAQKMKQEKYPAGALLIRQGDPGDKFYILKEGRTEVLIDSGEESEGWPTSSARRVREMGEGDVFGEKALLSGEARSATVRALTEVDVFYLTKTDFLKALEVSQSFKDQLLRVIAQRT